MKPLPFLLAGLIALAISACATPESAPTQIAPPPPTTPPPSDTPSPTETPAPTETPPPPSPDLIALSGRWDAQPRRAWEIVVSDTYITVVEDFLRQAGMPATPVEIDSIYRFDIEGDGFEEVLIAASYFADGPIPPGAAPGDYSILILRALVDGQVTSVPLIDQHYPSARPGIHPAHFRIGGILDLNGDGAYDLIAIGEDAFSTHYWTFDLTQPALEPVAQMSCMP